MLLFCRWVVCWAPVVTELRLLDVALSARNRIESCVDGFIMNNLAPVPDTQIRMCMLFMGALAAN